MGHSGQELYIDLLNTFTKKVSKPQHTSPAYYEGVRVSFLLQSIVPEI